MSSFFTIFAAEFKKKGEKYEKNSSFYVVCACRNTNVFTE